MGWFVPNFEKGRAAFATRRVEIPCVSSLREIRGKCVLARPQNDRRFSGWFRALGIRRALPQVTDGTARGPTQRAPRRRRGEGRLDRIAASKREPPSRPQRPRTAAKPFCVSCFRAETEDRRKGSCATSATQESTRPLSRRSRPTDCPGDRSGPTKDGGELTSKPRRRHAPQLNSQAPIVFLSILQANENLSAPW